MEGLKSCSIGLQKGNYFALGSPLSEGQKGGGMIFEKTLRMTEDCC